ncbi:hypothetical protein WN944_021912 [Citrus x changshan-huyou]|uniref:Uncharacterized protein n=1 Tax=Citrus x changshan-huyou TaxID=2935761 RepID=A0AAP0MXL8_9ROSI
MDTYSQNIRAKESDKLENVFTFGKFSMGFATNHHLYNRDTIKGYDFCNRHPHHRDTTSSIVALLPLPASHDSCAPPIFAAKLLALAATTLQLVKLKTAEENKGEQPLLPVIGFRQQQITLALFLFYV